jgi:hypothetical protein
MLPADRGDVRVFMQAGQRKRGVSDRYVPGLAMKNPGLSLGDRLKEDDRIIYRCMGEFHRRIAVGV